MVKRSISKLFGSKSIVFFLSLLISAAASFAFAPDVAAQEATLRLDWKINGVHLPFLLAYERGYFKDEGINLRIFEGQGSGDTVSAMASGADTFGYADYAVMAGGISKGMPLKGVFGILRKTVWTIVTYEKDSIKTPKDLSGKSIATVGGAQPLFAPFLKANGIRPDAVVQRVVSPTAMDQVFMDGKVDSLLVTLPGSGILLKLWGEKAGKKVAFLHYADWGTNMLAHGIIVHKNSIEKDPDLIKRFLRGLKKGLEETPKNIDEAIAAAIKNYPITKGREETLRAQYLATLDFYNTEATKGKPLGWMAKSDWEQTQKVLIEAGRVEKPLTIETYYTNQYIP